METDVLAFIENFKRGFDKEYLEKVFSKGNCYHFALILKGMFGGVIYYDIAKGHFITGIKDNYYDIKGLAEKTFDTYDFEILQIIEPNLYDRVLNDCVYRSPVYFPDLFR